MRPQTDRSQWEDEEISEFAWKSKVSVTGGKLALKAIAAAATDKAEQWKCSMISLTIAPYWLLFGRTETGGVQNWAIRAELQLIESGWEEEQKLLLLLGGWMDNLWAFGEMLLRQL